MSPKTPEQMIAELYQKVIGIPENPHDDGMIGDIAEIKASVKNMNALVASNVLRVTRVEDRVESVKDRVVIVEGKIEDLRDVPRPVRLTSRQAIYGGGGAAGFLGVVLFALGKLAGWW